MFYITLDDWNKVAATHRLKEPPVVTTKVIKMTRYGEVPDKHTHIRVVAVVLINVHDLDFWVIRGFYHGDRWVPKEEAAKNYARSLEGPYLDHGVAVTKPKAKTKLKVTKEQALHNACMEDAFGPHGQG